MNVHVVYQVLILFVITLIGVYARKKNYTNKEVNRGLTQLILNISLPLFIISSFLVKYSSEMLINAAKVFAYSVIILIGLLMIGKIIFSKFPQNRRSVLRFITTFSNSGFIGFPVLYSLFGNLGVFYGAVYNVAFNIFQYTFGIMIFTQKKDWKAIKKLAVNPVIISIIIGLLIFRFSLQLPVPIATTIKMVGDMTIPLAMLLNGSMLAEIEIKEAFTGFSVYIITLIRLIAAPLLVLLLLKNLGVEGHILKVLVIIQAMPAAATTAVISEQYGGDEVFASKCIFMTTAFSIFTIPIIIQLL